MRLFNRTNAQFNDRLIDESVEISDGAIAIDGVLMPVLIQERDGWESGT